MESRMDSGSGRLAFCSLGTQIMFHDKSHYEIIHYWSIIRRNDGIWIRYRMSSVVLENSRDILLAVD